MLKRFNFSWADWLTALGLVVGSSGILLQIVTNNVNVPAPVGAIVMVALAGVIALRLWRWTTTVSGVIAFVILFIGIFIAPGFFNRLGDPTRFGPFLGTLLQTLGLLTAVVGSVVATIERANPQVEIPGSRYKRNQGKKSPGVYPVN
ncbi:MAG: hypothetical protein J0I20_11775 [Chloroflexi bacterium]|nr:hypothetical protein [Chloroflexota bacterium]OJV92412.1 MAG: hypothetical protein BGO39_31295 [Chloroflexi bacterium 54-19]